MSTDALIAGVDVGTTTVKAGIYDPQGLPVASAAVPTPSHAPAPERAEHHADELWAAVADALRAAVDCLDDPAGIVGVAVASVAEAGVPVDAHGAATAPVIAWHDRRARAQARRLADAVGAHRLRSITGLPSSPIYGVYKLAWLAEHEPDAVARTRVWLNVADYVAYRLCGQAATDLSLATRTGALDLRARAWSDEVLGAAGVPRSVFAPLVASGTPLGHVTPQASAATGLPTSATVAAGGHDHVCGALAAGVLDPGRALDSIGTAESLLVPLREPLAPDDDAPRYSQGVHVAADRWYVARGIHAGGASIDWVLRTVGAPSERSRLLGEAARVPIGARGVVFTPAGHLPAAADAAGGVLAGLQPTTTRADLVRAVLEGLAVTGHDVLSLLVAQAAGPTPPRVRVIGGGARNRLLLEIKAAVSGRPLRRPDTPEATTLGAALLAGVAAGLFPDAAAAAEAARYTLEEVAADPTDVAAYAALAPRVRAPASG